MALALEYKYKVIDVLLSIFGRIGSTVWVHTTINRPITADTGIQKCCKSRHRETLCTQSDYGWLGTHVRSFVPTFVGPSARPSCGDLFAWMVEASALHNLLTFGVVSKTKWNNLK